MIMNNSRFLHIAAVWLAVLFAAGCARTPRLDVLSFTTSQETPSAPGCPLTHRLDVSLEYPEVKGDKDLAAVTIRQSIFEAAFGEKYDTLNVADAAARYAEDLAAEFKELSAAMWRGWQQAGISDPSAEEWSDSIEGYFAGQNGRYVSYIVNIVDYTGGPHDNSSTRAMVFDLKTGGAVTLDDLFVPGFDARLTGILNSHLPKSLSPEEVESLFEDTVHPTGNYILTSDSITFIYNPMEIAPAYVGTPSISVPVSELRKAGLLAKKLKEW